MEPVLRLDTFLTNLAKFENCSGKFSYSWEKLIVTEVILCTGNNDDLDYQRNGNID